MCVRKFRNCLVGIRVVTRRFYFEMETCTYLVISSVLTARGVPGGTAAKTFDDAYLDEFSKSKMKDN